MKDFIQTKDLFKSVSAMIWFTSLDAILEWSKAYGADSAKNSITDFSMKLLKPRRVKVSGDRAYIVLPAIYGFKQRLKPMQKRGTITATLERVDKK
jgi:hypothetical protein